MCAAICIDAPSLPGKCSKLWALISFRGTLDLQGRMLPTQLCGLDFSSFCSVRLHPRFFFICRTLLKTAILLVLRALGLSLDAVLTATYIGQVLRQFEKCVETTIQLRCRFD